MLIPVLLLLLLLPLYFLLLLSLRVISISASGSIGIRDDIAKYKVAWTRQLLAIVVSLFLPILTFIPILLFLFDITEGVWRASEKGFFIVTGELAK